MLTETGRLPDLIDIKDTFESGVAMHHERTAIRDVFASGKRVVRGGRHPLQHEIIGECAKIQRSLW